MFWRAAVSDWRWVVGDGRLTIIGKLLYKHRIGSMGQVTMRAECRAKVGSERKARKRRRTERRGGAVNCVND